MMAPLALSPQALRDHEDAYSSVFSRAEPTFATASPRFYAYY
jgi:hypothetical protein